MHYVGSRKSQTDPLASIPLFRPAASVMRPVHWPAPAPSAPHVSPVHYLPPTEQELLRRELGNAEAGLAEALRVYEAARADIGEANATWTVPIMSGSRILMPARRYSPERIRERKSYAFGRGCARCPGPADAGIPRGARHYPRSSPGQQARSCFPDRGFSAVTAPHPDAALLLLCGELRVLQEGWQRLWEATPETGPNGAADQVFEEFAEYVWPGFRSAATDDEEDPARQLLTLRATTLDGLRAKAAAVKAIDDASGYSMCCRDDYCELVASLLEDAAGPAAMAIGEDATPKTPSIASATTA